MKTMLALFIFVSLNAWSQENSCPKNSAVFKATKLASTKIATTSLLQMNRGTQRLETGVVCFQYAQILTTLASLKVSTELARELNCRQKSIEALELQTAFLTKRVNDILGADLVKACELGGEITLEALSRLEILELSAGFGLAAQMISLLTI